jgi:hypothetical protein
MRKQTTYAHLNMVLVDIAQQLQSPYFALMQEQKIAFINESNKLTIDRMHAGMRAISEKYCRKNEKGGFIITAGKMTYYDQQSEQAFYKEYAEFMQTKIDLTY